MCITLLSVYEKIKGYFLNEQPSHGIVIFEVLRFITPHFTF